VALLFWLLGLGRPSVAVAIALDLSGSTYNNTQEQFNTPRTVMAQEVQAVKAYLDKNISGILRQPNQIQIFGFADGVRPLTQKFQEDSKQIKRELDQSLNSDLIEIIGDGTNLDIAIQEGIDALDTISDRCRELLVVTDGVVSVAQQVVNEAKDKRVTINAVVIGDKTLDLQQATETTGGNYLSGELSNLEQLFTEKLFEHFNSNWNWILLWLGLAWICLMWMIIMPLDRWLFQGLLRIRMDISGKLSLGNAWFWTALTPLIIWQLYQLFNLVLPLINQC
jgi:Ca-activated chloride channel family protein